MTPSYTVRPDTENRIFMVRNAILTTWQSAAVSAQNSSVRSLPACHRVATTLDADKPVAEVWRGTRHSGSSSTIFLRRIGLHCTSNTHLSTIQRPRLRASNCKPITGQWEERYECEIEAESAGL